VADNVLAATVERLHINYPVVKMDDGLYDAYGAPQRLPTTYVYDKSGPSTTASRARCRASGWPSCSTSCWRSRIRRILARDAGPFRRPRRRSRARRGFASTPNRPPW
jgi:hypothetical protein